MATERQLALILACLDRLEGKVDALDARLKQFSAVSGLDAETSVANGKKNCAINRCIDLLYTDAVASMAGNVKKLMPQPPSSIAASKLISDSTLLQTKPPTDATCPSKTATTVVSRNDCKIPSTSTMSTQPSDNQVKEDIRRQVENAKQKEPKTVTEVHTQSESKGPEILPQNPAKGANRQQVVTLAEQPQEKNSGNLQSESLRRSARNVNKCPPNYSQGVRSKNGKRTKNDKLKKESQTEVASTVLFQKQAQEAIQIDSSKQTRSESRASGDEQFKVTVATSVASTSTVSSLGETQVKPRLEITGASSCAPSHIIANWPGVADRRNLWEMRIKSN